MMRNHHDMLSAIIETFKATESIVPLGDHTSFRKLCHTNMVDILCQNADDTIIGKDLDYAENILDLLLDGYNVFFKKSVNIEWSNLTREQRLEKVSRLQNAPQIEQRSKEWYLNFAKVLTASEFSSLFGSPRQRRALILSKASPKIDETTLFRTACPTDEMTPMGWGIRFEPVIKQILEYKFNCKIYEPGRITHPAKESLAASADGVFAESPDTKQLGRLVEIKCPYSRVIGGEIPFEYWVQMQIQMEVTDIDECEYVEVELLSRKPKQPEVDLSGCEIYGTVYLIKPIVEDGEKFQYKYLYGPICSTALQPEVPNGYEVIETIPWGFKKWHRVIVQRDRTWYASTEPWQNAFWQDVENAKNGVTLCFGDSTPSTPKAPVQCLIVDDE